MLLVWTNGSIRDFQPPQPIPPDSPWVSCIPWSGRPQAGSRSPHCNGVPEISTAITHLRDVLGDQTYESLARKGETMTTTAIVTYAYDQIDQARAELNAVSK
jgi:hypothetical protein